jgi:hypothetical protein
MNNDWKITKIESHDENMMADCYYVSTSDIYDHQYLCRDGIVRDGCIEGVLPSYDREKILENSMGGYFETLEEAQKVLREFGR